MTIKLSNKKDLLFLNNTIKLTFIIEEF